MQLNSLKEIFSQLNNKNSGQLKNIVLSILFKGGGVILSLIFFRISLLALGNSNMGVWLTISSISSWITFFDFGIGNGLKNKLTELTALQQYDEARKVISTAYIISFIVSSALSLIFILAALFIPWSKVLNTQTISNNVLQWCVTATLVSISLRLTSDLILAITTAMHKAYLAALVGFFINLITLIVSFIIFQIKYGSLQVFVFVVSVIPFIPTLFFSLWFFSTQEKKIRPQFNGFDKKYVNILLTSGTSFFVIQLMYLIIFTTDNLIVAQLFSPNEVTVYNTAYKYFAIISFLFAILITPFWPAITKANTCNDDNAIKKIINTLLYYWYISIIVVLIMILAANWIYKTWTSNAVQVPFSLTIAMSIYVLVSSWNSIFATYLNAVNKVKLHVFYSIIAGILNIPLCYFFSKVMNLGTTGVMLATISCLLMGAFFAPIQYFFLINKKAKGIWNK